MIVSIRGKINSLLRCWKTGCDKDRYFKAPNMIQRSRHISAIIKRLALFEVVVILGTRPSLPGLLGLLIRRYLDILTDALVVRQLQPWHANLSKRQAKAPKIYIRDSGLLHSLLRIGGGKRLGIRSQAYRNTEADRGRRD